jgi:MFS family permease
MSAGDKDVEDAHFRRVVLVMAVGIFVTGLGWPGLIGRLPFGLYLKNDLHLPPQDVAAFWAVGTLAWYIKPLAGLICDGFPLLGTRRRWYLCAGSAASSLLWIAFAAVPRSYGAMMAVMVALNAAMVVVSTALGGMLVEEGQKHGATGRLSSLRMGLEGVMSLVAGPLGGWLAARTFGWTAGAGAAIVFSLAPLAFFYIREPRRAVRDRAVWATARQQLAHIVRSRPMWGATALLFLVYLAPGFQTPLLYHQQDVLKLDAATMGWLQFLGGAGALLGAAAYSWLCRRIALYPLLVLGVFLNAASVLFYLGYHSRTAAMIIESSAGIVGTVGLLPLYDLAVRAAPKGSESFAYALMMSIRTIAAIAISDVLGSYLYGHVHLRLEQLVWLNAGSTIAVLLFLPLLPAALMAGREGQRPR